MRAYTAFPLFAGMILAACAAPSLTGVGYAGKEAVFPGWIDVVQRAAADALAASGFDVSEPEPRYVRGSRPGAERVLIWLTPVGRSKTIVRIYTRRASLPDQKIWDDEIFARMEEALGKREPAGASN